MAEFENATFDPDGSGIDDGYSFDLPDPPLDFQQQLLRIRGAFSEHAR